MRKTRSAVWLGPCVAMSAVLSWGARSEDAPLAFAVRLGLPTEDHVECTDWGSRTFTTAGRLHGFFRADGLTVELVEECLRHGADPNAPDDEGQTALHLAARWEADPKVIDALVAAGAYADLPDNVGKTPIDWAVDGGTPAVVAALRRTSSAHVGEE